MNFFSRVTYNDRMSPLDFDLFRKIHVLMGVTPDYFEVCLMVRILLSFSSRVEIAKYICLGRRRHESIPGLSEVPRQLYAP